MNRPFSLIVGGLSDLAEMELPGIELRPELLRADGLHSPTSAA